MTISREQQIEILKKMSDEEIDFSDAPEATEAQLASLRAFVPPKKKTITIKLDEDILKWFKNEQPKGGYQTFINAVLRDYVQRHSREKERNRNVD